MIVWGGFNYNTNTYFNTGGRYNPGTDKWTLTTTSSAPSGRAWHSEVWTGSEMIVWGGWNGSSCVGTGARYNPQADAWSAMSSTNAPTARTDATAVWTGTEMIVWGGWDGSNRLSNGARYNPATDTWTPITNANAPSARYDTRSVWTGNQMIVWAGNQGVWRVSDSFVNSGGIYDPISDTWSVTDTSAAPSSRHGNIAVWTGDQMVVLGGWAGSFLNTGGRLKPNGLLYLFQRQ